MYEIIYNGIRSSEYGVYAKERPNIPAARKKSNETYLAGRDGVLYEEEDAYEETSINILFNYIGQEKEWMERWRMIQEWLSPRNSKLQISDDEAYFFKIVKVELEENERSSRRVGNFTATFRTKDGLSYLVDGTAEYSIDAVRYNPYLATHPMYYVIGQGTCEIEMNGNRFSVDVAGGIYIDTERQMTLLPDGTVNNTAAKGEYEGIYLLPGRNSIKISQGFDVKVTPNWRRL